jgi:alkanesulfonate monooxygenase SsuD/methylene tetrahydromethanopterin reductase-like flavin-dependent oxidoreductase (luciferase family)
MHIDRVYINIKEKIPIVIAAQGPKALDVAGAIADGWMAPVSDVEDSSKT